MAAGLDAWSGPVVCPYGGRNHRGPHAGRAERLERASRSARIHRGRAGEVVLVAVAVGLDLVAPRGRTSRDQVGVGGGVLAQAEERGRQAELVEPVEHGAAWCGGRDRRRR